ncbi:hypothetical protein ACT4UM_20850 [Bacillus sp. SS-TM]
MRERSMINKNIAEEINQTLEELWILLETKERSYTNFSIIGLLISMLPLFLIILALRWVRFI